jgi:hypothetical protein
MNWARALAKLAGQLVGEEKAWVLRHGVEVALLIGSERDQAEALMELAPCLEGELLVALARQLEAELHTALAIEDNGGEPYWPTALAVLRGRLGGSEGAEKARASALNPDGRIVIHLARQQVPIGYHQEEKWAQVLAGLAGRLEGDEKTTALAYGLAAALATKYAGYRVKALVALLPHLEDKAKAWALMHGLEAAQVIIRVNDRVEALVALAAHLEGAAKVWVLERGMEAVMEIGSEEGMPPISREQERSRALVALAPQLEDELFGTGLGVGVEDSG